MKQLKPELINNNWVFFEVDWERNVYAFVNPIKKERVFADCVEGSFGTKESAVEWLKRKLAKGRVKKTIGERKKKRKIYTYGEDVVDLYSSGGGY